MTFATKTMNLSTTIVLMDHSRALENLCPVCGRAVMPRSAKVKHLCSNYTGQLKKVFGVDVQSDNPCIHPIHFAIRAS